MVITFAVQFFALVTISNATAGVSDETTINTNSDYRYFHYNNSGNEEVQSDTIHLDNIPVENQKHEDANLINNLQKSIKTIKEISDVSISLIEENSKSKSILVELSLFENEILSKEKQELIKKMIATVIEDISIDNINIKIFEQNK